MSAFDSCDIVTLKGGFVAPLKALQVMWDLESRGVRVAADGDGLRVGPRNLLTMEDRANISTWKAALRAIAAYAPTSAEVS